MRKGNVFQEKNPLEIPLEILNAKVNTCGLTVKDTNISEKNKQMEDRMSSMRVEQPPKCYKKLC